MQRAGTCKHFNGMGLDHGKTCEAGVNYRAHVGGLDLGWCTRAPCIREGRARSTGEIVPCALYLEPTGEEIAASKAESEAHFETFKLSFPLIARVKKMQKGRNWSGVEECPACKGLLHLSHAASNGHVHGKCETENCLNWME